MRDVILRFLSQIPAPVWFALGVFVLWCLHGLLDDLVAIARGQDSHARRPAKGRQDEEMEKGQRRARAGRERVARLDGVRSAREAACSLIP